MEECGLKYVYLLFSNLYIWIISMKFLAVYESQMWFLISVFHHKNLFRLLLPRIR